MSNSGVVNMSINNSGSTIQVTVENGQINMPKEKNPDPYVKLTVGRKSEKTKTQKNTNSPVWNQTFTFPASPNDVLQVELLDDDFGKDDKIMQASLPIASLPPGMSRQVVPQSAGVGYAQGPPGPPRYNGPYYPWVRPEKPLDTYFTHYTPNTHALGGGSSPRFSGRQSPLLYGMGMRNSSPMGQRSPSPMGGGSPPGGYGMPPMGGSPMGRPPSPMRSWKGSPSGYAGGSPMMMHGSPAAGRFSPTMGMGPGGHSPPPPMGMYDYSPLPGRQSPMMGPRPGYGHGYGGWNGM